MRHGWRLGVALVAALLPCAANADLEVSAQPTKVVLGVDQHVTLTVKNVPAGAKLNTYASQGALAPAPGPTKDGEAKFVWTAPGTHVPASALIAFWADGGPMPDVTAIALPLLGRTDVEADTDPGATVTVEIGAAHFGPVKANAKGHVAVPVEVPPNARTAKVLAETGTQKTTKEVTLDVPASDPIAAVFTAEPLVSKSKNWLIVMEAEPIAPDAIGVQFQGATSALRAGHPGWALYEVVPDGSPYGVDVRISVKDRPEAHAQAHAAITEPPEPVAPQHVPRLWFVGVDLGGYFAGGSTGGLIANLSLGYPLPIPKVQTWAELSVGYHSIGMTPLQTSLGEVDPSASTVPVLLSLRGRVFNSDPWSVHVRIGGGIEPFWLSTSSITAPTMSLNGSVPEGFGAAEGVYAAGNFDLYVELGVTIAQRVDSTYGNPFTGGFLAVGLRYVDR